MLRTLEEASAVAVKVINKSNATPLRAPNNLTRVVHHARSLLAVERTAS